MHPLDHIGNCHAIRSNCHQPTWQPRHRPSTSAYLGRCGHGQPPKANNDRSRFETKCQDKGSSLFNLTVRPGARIHEAACRPLPHASTPHDDVQDSGRLPRARS